MFKNIQKLSFFVAIFIFVIFQVVNAQSINQNLAQSTSISGDERTKLELELKQLEEESKNIQLQLDSKKGERKGLESELSKISLKISDSKNKIKQTQTTIKKIAGDIVVKEDTIQTLNKKINKSENYISKSLVDLRKLDDVRAVIAFSEDGAFSEVFKDFGDYKAIQNRLTESMDSLKTNKKFVEVEKEVLLDKKDETEALKKKQEQDRQEEEARSSEQKKLISVTKQQESDYKKVLAEKNAKVAQIKNRLFVLRDAGGITFQTAQQYAKEAGKATGVRPALILGILKQESDLGKNEGRCYVTDFTTGTGVHSKTGAVMPRTMNPTRDIPPFLEITKALGIDASKRLVSCPLSYGYGGAMGPTQFIPSTWKGYQSRVASMNGSLGDPWSGRDAIAATALYLADSGATSQNYADERNAACKYYSGKVCSRGVGAPGYGNSVMAHAASFQSDIDLLNGN